MEVMLHVGGGGGHELFIEHFNLNIDLVPTQTSSTKSSAVSSTTVTHPA